MKELLEIVTVFDELCATGKSAALATVIAVEGSAYRRPGARMLVAEDGRTWGGVSGGCLERDVARRARGVIETGRPLHCTYDTADDETATPGAATGCGGIVHLFIQSLSASSPGPIPALRRVVHDRRPITLHTPARRDGQTFVEHLAPSQSLVLFGAGGDVVPVVAMAKLLGWHVTVVGTRPATGLHERFATADAVVVTESSAPLAGVTIESDAAVVVMTHNIGRDTAILAALHGPFRYLGLLGPEHRTRRVLSKLPGRSVRDVDDAQFFNPVGLDLGAQTPEEIALSIVSEIQAVLRNATARPLRERQVVLHEMLPLETSMEMADATFTPRCSCPL